MNQPYGKIYGVGAGTGDPELLTLKAARILQEIPLVVCPRSKSSSALQDIIAYLGIEHKVTFVDIPMVADKQVVSTAYDRAFEVLLHAVVAGRGVAYLTLGDPSLYSTFSPLLRRAKNEGVALEVVPGIIAPCTLAAAGLQPLAEGDEPLTIIPGSFASDLPDHNLSLMKVRRHFDELVLELERTGRLNQSILGVRLGMSDERIEHDLRLCAAPDSYFSTVNVRILDDKRADQRTAIPSRVESNEKPRSMR